MERVVHSKYDLIKVFYGPTLEGCLEEANNFGREIIHFQYEVATTYPVTSYRLVVAFGRLK